MNYFSSKTVLNLLIIVVLISGLLIGIVVVKNEQDNRSHASGYNMPQHRIGVRQGANGGEFYNRDLNTVFTPRGYNYIRLANQPDPFSPSTYSYYHSTFDPGRYDPYKAQGALQQMSHDGYNTIRVFINEDTVGDPQGGLSSVYLDNVTDFLSRAAKSNIYTILTFPTVPKLGGYYTANLTPNIQGYNWFYLSQQGIDAKKKYLTDFINGLKARNAQTDYILSYSIENEQYFDSSQMPFSSSIQQEGSNQRGAGTVARIIQTASGNYNINIASQKQQMMDSNLVNWINQVRASILALDPTALVSVGFFSPLALGQGDTRMVRTYWAIASSDKGGSMADFIDLHIYPGYHPLQNDITAFEISSNSKPLILGEIGAAKNIYANTTLAAYALRDLQVNTCKLYHFKGWLMWTYDTNEQPGYWTGLDNSGAINGILAPIIRSNPCQ